MTFRKSIIGGCVVAALAIGVAACGSSGSSSTSGGSSGAKTVDVYSSLPLQGASKDQTGAMVQGMKLALSSRPENKAGNVTVKYTSLRRLDGPGR